MQKLVLVLALFACATYASICHSWGDPHNKLLNGKDYNFYGSQGDFLFFKYGRDLVVQERVIDSATWRANTLLIGAAVRFGKTVFEIQNDVTRLNKKVATASELKAAGIQIKGNVYTISYKKITIKIHNHGHNDAISGKNYLSLYVDVPAAIQNDKKIRLRGLCVDQNIPGYAIRRRSLFATKAKVVKLPPRPKRQFTRAQTRAAIKACRGTGLQARASIKNCAYDYLRAKDKAAILRAYKSDHKDNVSLRKVDKKVNKAIKKSKKNKRARRALKKCRRSNNRLRRQVASLKAALARARAAERRANDRARSAERQVSSLRTELSRARSSYSRAQAEIRNLRSQLASLRRTCDAKIAQIQRNARSTIERIQRDARYRLNRTVAQYNQQINYLNNQCRARIQQINNQAQQAVNNLHAQVRYYKAQAQQYYQRLMSKRY